MRVAMAKGKGEGRPTSMEDTGVVMGGNVHHCMPAQSLLGDEVTNLEMLEENITAKAFAENLLVCHLPTRQSSPSRWHGKWTVPLPPFFIQPIVDISIHEYLCERHICKTFAGSPPSTLFSFFFKKNRNTGVQKTEHK